MTELTRKLHFGRNAREMLDDVFADHRRMECGAAAGQHNATDVAQFSRRHLETTELRAAIISAKSTAHRIPHRAGLLKDFLEHVMRVVALLDVLIAELDF